MTFHQFYESAQNDTLIKIQNAIEHGGGEIFVVGGPVRDYLNGKDPKDIDFMVRKLTLPQIQQIVSTLGKANEVGESFGIVKGTIDGEEFDFAIPRRKETQVGGKHTDFQVETDPNARVEDDLGRRDFTFNAMAVPLRNFIEAKRTGEPLKGVIDPYGGQQDLRNNVIKSVGNPKNRFNEDLLRILRSIQFSVRFGFNIDPETTQAIKELAPELHPSRGRVTGERIFEEFKKAWTKGSGNSALFIDQLQNLGVGKILFGSSFMPIPVKLAGLQGADLVAGQFIAFFLRGGDFQIMKPDTHYQKVLELAKNITTDKDPFTYIGNMKETLPIELAFFKEYNPQLGEKVHKMMNTALIPKDLTIGGQELMSILGVTSPKEGKKVGIAQKMLLSAIWDGLIKNDPDSIRKFLAETPLENV